MKKKISGVIIIVAVAAATIWNFNQSKNEMTLSELALANVEALATPESDGGKNCWSYCCQTDYNKCLDAQLASGCTGTNITLDTSC